MGNKYKINWKAELKTTVLLALFGGPAVLLFCRSCLTTWETAAPSMTFSALMWILLWQGNGHLSDYITHRISWLENPGKRFIVGVIGVLVYTPLAVYLLYLFIRAVFDVGVESIESTIIGAIIVTFLISFFLNAWHFLRHWRKAELERAELIKEQMATKYESLKNQVNPHFLFNSLNALTNLVYEDQDQAASFIRQLSKVYRYVLDTRSQELVTLSTELEFLDSYIYLQKIRFDDKLQVNIDVNGQEQSMVPPIAIQMLLENAIKHNTIAEEEPLTIDIAIEDNAFIVVKNNLQKKNIPLEASSGMGLNNIKARYEFLSDRSVEIIENDEHFIVKLPLLELKES